MTNALYAVSDLRDVDAVRAYVVSHGGEILSERQHPFINGTAKTQFRVRDESGRVWLLTPASDAACERWGGRLAPYQWLEQR